MIPRVALVVVVLSGFAGMPGISAAQSAKACGTAPVVRADAQPNIFSTQQEIWLGEAFRDMRESDAEPVKDTTLDTYLQGLADKLAVNLPEPHVPFVVHLVESPEVNAWSIPGGGIYVTRKLASVARSEDELAAVLGHEMGHIAAHQFAFEFTTQFGRLLKVTQVGDRKDVYARFQQLVDASLEDKHPPKSKEDLEQDEADRIGVYLVAAAGYRAGAFAEFFDRTFFVGGKTGNRLSDLFGMT